MDDSHSINSFSDDLALSLPPERDLHGGVPMNILMTTSISGRANMSRSTDRNLDNLGKNFKKFGGVWGPGRSVGSLRAVEREEEWSIEGSVFMTTSIFSRANMSRSNLT